MVFFARLVGNFEVADDITPINIENFRLISSTHAVQLLSGSLISRCIIMCMWCLVQSFLLYSEHILGVSWNILRYA
jgi:hypothetical protein